MAYTVSVIVVACDEWDWHETINSVAGQTYSEYDVIIVDITSTNACFDWLQCNFADNDQIIYLKNDNVSTVPLAINWAANISEKDYLAFALYGCAWHRDKLSLQMSGLRPGEPLDCFYCAEKIIGEKESIIPDNTLPPYKRIGELFPDLVREKTVSIDTLVVKRDVFTTIGGFDQDCSVLWDYVFILKLSLKHTIYFMEKVLSVRLYNPISPEDELGVQMLILCEFEKELRDMELKKEKLYLVIDFARQNKITELYDEYAQVLAEDNEYALYTEEYIRNVLKHRIPRLCNSSNISAVTNCVGCSACESICPVNAISMKENEEGFLYPCVDTQKCIMCGKCIRVCPTQNEVASTSLPDDAYAVQWNDEERMKSSSGAVFPFLAKSFISIGGYVCGVVYDENMHVKHIVSNKLEDIERMQTSKYVQSDMRGVYGNIKELLDKGYDVLFSGCSCQVAGVKTYLNKDYENLYTLDVVCHGVPSPGVFENYLKEFPKEHGKIKGVNFRNKKTHGWKPGVYVEFEDGFSMASKSYEPYMASFLSNWILRDSCYECEFRPERYSDITLGDFWGIQNIDSSVEDGKGTSLVLANTSKGKELLSVIKDVSVTCKKYNVNDAILYNPSIVCSAEKPIFRKFLFDKLKNNSLPVSINKAISDIHFDIGMAVMWASNYGNALTNYALYKVLSERYSVLAIDSLNLVPIGRFKRFAKQYYNLSTQYLPMLGLESIAEKCDTIVVGSDQTWNYYFSDIFKYGDYFQLDFVKGNQKRISYAASFGMMGAQPPAAEYKSKYEAFDAISVRERFGVDICRDDYGVKAEWVLDPVFLLDAKDYDKLEANAKVKEDEPFIMAYLLNPTPEKRAVCKRIQQLLGGIKIINVSENSPELRDRYCHILEFDHVKGDIEIEDWIYYMKNCQFVITDSFHGTCFSVIFNKRYISFVNRQPGRFEVFNEFTGTAERILRQIDVNAVDKFIEPMDYEIINREVEERRKRSLKWLYNALK